MIDVAIMGHGVVGSGVAEVLRKNRETIAKKAKTEIRIRHILDLRAFPDLPYSDLFTKSFDDILNDDDVKVVAEVMGGIHPAYDYVKALLEKGKHVVTSNKELVAEKGAQLLRIAQQKNVNFLFEASVGGGIPVLRPIAQCLAANDLYEIVGILNGTTNFILTKMVRDGMSFADALKLAQDLGYAERNPAADVEGADACRKICILASLAFGRHVYPQQVATEGITNVSLEDIDYAAGCDCAIKLVGRARLLPDGRVTASVYPALIHKDSPLYAVGDVFNAVLVRGDAIGDVMFYGQGAGKLPTASAVVADMIDCVKHLCARKYLEWADGGDDYVADPLEDDTRLFVRAAVENKKAAVAELRERFGPVIIVPADRPDEHTLTFVTPVSTERVLRRAVGSLTHSAPVSILHIID